MGRLPPRAAARLAIEWAEAMDARSGGIAGRCGRGGWPSTTVDPTIPEKVAKVLAEHPRWIRRSLHRNEHLDEADEALRG